MDFIAHMLPIFAQVSMEWLAPLMQLGVAGVVIAWFMFTVTPQLKLIDRSQLWMAKSMLLLTIAIKEANPSVKTEAAELLKEIEQQTRRPDER